MSRVEQKTERNETGKQTLTTPPHLSSHPQRLLLIFGHTQIVEHYIVFLPLPKLSQSQTQRVGAMLMRMSSGIVKLRT